MSCRPQGPTSLVRAPPAPVKDRYLEETAPDRSPCLEKSNRESGDREQSLTGNPKHQTKIEDVLKAPKDSQNEPDPPTDPQPTQAATSLKRLRTETAASRHETRGPRAWKQQN